MKINVPTLKSKKEQLNNLSVEHKTIYSNFKNYLDTSDLYWDDPNSDDFFILTKLEQIRFEQTTLELNKLIQIYNFLTTNYGKYGNIIFAELKAMASILESFKSVINSIDNAISAFNGIDASLPEGAAAKGKIGELNTLKVTAKSAMKKVEEILLDMVKIENNVASMTGGLKLEPIKEDDVEIYRKSGVKYLGEGYGMYFMDQVEMKKIIDYMNESNIKEQSIDNSLQEVLSTINTPYVSDNSGLLNSKCNEFKEKIYILYKYHVNDYLVVTDCYNFYITSAEKSKQDIAKVIESRDLNG